MHHVRLLAFVGILMSYSTDLYAQAPHSLQDVAKRDCRLIASATCQTASAELYKLGSKFQLLYSANRNSPQQLLLCLPSTVTHVDKVMLVNQSLILIAGVFRQKPGCWRKRASTVPYTNLLALVGFSGQQLSKPILIEGMTCRNCYQLGPETFSVSALVSPPHDTFQVGPNCNINVRISDLIHSIPQYTISSKGFNSLPAHQQLAYCEEQSAFKKDDFRSPSSENSAAVHQQRRSDMFSLSGLQIDPELAMPHLSETLRAKLSSSSHEDISSIISPRSRLRRQAFSQTDLEICSSPRSSSPSSRTN